MKVLSCNFGAILLKKPKNARDSVPLISAPQQVYYLVMSANLMHGLFIKCPLCLGASFTKHKQMVRIYYLRCGQTGVKNKDGKLVPANTKRMV